MAFFPITKDTFAGLVVVNVVAILATLALFSITVRVIWLAILRLYKRNITQTREYVFFHTQLGYYAACLLIANMFSSAAGLMGLPYLFKRGITEDALCTAQAMFMQFGNIATAYFTVSIAVHTFTSLVLRRRQSVVIYSTTISLGWISAAFISSLPLIMPKPRGPIYGEYNLTCGVRPPYPAHQFLLHLLPIFIAAFVSAVLYSLIFLVLRGTLVIKGGVKLTLNPNERWTGEGGENYHRFIQGIARSMLWYPVAYIVFLIPYSITKLLILSGFKVQFGALIFAYVCWFLLGVANVLLLYNTFRMLYPAFDTKFTTRQDVESFGTAEKFRRATYGVGQSMDNHDLPHRIPEYSFSPTPDSERSDTPSYPEKTATVPSFYNYPISPPVVLSSPSTYNGPPSSFNKPIVTDHFRSESINSTHTYITHSRQASSDSLVSLPVPPRRTRSPPTARGPALQVRNTPSPTGSFQAPEPSPPSTRRLLTPPSGSHRQSSSVSSTDLLNDISDWVAKQRPDGSMPRGIKNRPMLSAVKPAFPSTAALNPRPRVGTPNASPLSYRNQSPPASASSYTSSRTGTAVDYVPTNPSAVPLMGPPPIGRYHHKTPQAGRSGSF
ncbi:hypothetical protein BDZ89DRAFT_1127304 [Hymenopellis radicata]|nr:hypothetical protein BDZ89DRAFT_1127304 [Hymenopellis radicata]